MMRGVVGGVVLVVVLASACGGGDLEPGDASVPDATDAALDAMIDAPPDAPPVTSGPCNPLTQAGCGVGEKCTWLIDALSPQYVGHVGCAPDGVAQVGGACMFGSPGATGYDNCAKGAVCGNYRGGAGTCKAICDQQGGSPACSSTNTCVTYAGLFVTGQLTPQAGGVCDESCDPLADNDFDGSGTASVKTGTVCAGADTLGCYGYPSYGTPPATGWSCTTDINFNVAQPLGLRHRVVCDQSNSCADAGPQIYVNSCNQGYLPLLYEASGSTNIICVAMCKPAVCYSGNCGASSENRPGVPASGHQCNATDRLGTFAATDHCQYLWWREVDDSGNMLVSSRSDQLGFCMDFAKYRYDSNGDNKVDTSDLSLPNCDLLGSGFGSGSDRAMPTTYFGAADLGCVPSAYTAMTATGKQRIPASSLGKRALTNLPRALYHRTVGP